MDRLEHIQSLIGSHYTIADIGCDHGKVSEYIAKSGLCKTLIVNDVSKLSLDKAKERLLLAKASDDNICDIKFMLCDGQELANQQIDCAVIAGIGGRIIEKIIKKIDVETLILSPQNFGYGVRECLYESGYKITIDNTIKDNGKFYDIIKASKGKSEPLDELSRAYGMFYKTKNDLLLERLLCDENAVSKYKMTKENEEKLQVIRRVIQWQQSNK